MDDDDTIDRPSADEPHPSSPAATDAPHFTVEVIRSPRRRRSVGAQMRGDVLRVTVPAWMSADDEQRWVDNMTARFGRRVSASRIDLGARAALLARRFDLPRPESIEWRGNMATRWGSCSIHRRTIGLSDRLARFPDWVIDAVIVHELCHLAEPDHGPRFWELANRYPKMERAIGYLMAKGTDDID